MCVYGMKDRKALIVLGRRWTPIYMQTTLPRYTCVKLTRPDYERDRSDMCRTRIKTSMVGRYGMIMMEHTDDVGRMVVFPTSWSSDEQT